MKITQDHSILRQKSTPIESVKEALEIMPKLEEALKQSGGVGVAAIQIGIAKTIAIFNNSKGVAYLINPQVKETKDEFIYPREGCLSIPNKFFDTLRYKELVITNSVIDGDRFREETWYFSYDDIPLETIAVQHELEHFEGKLILDHNVKLEPVKVEKKAGRNDPCPCGSKLKYKKCCGK